MDLYLIESHQSTPPRHDTHSVYPANRVSGGAGKGKDKPRGVPGTVDLLQSRIIAPQVGEWGGVSVCVGAVVPGLHGPIGRFIRAFTHPPLIYQNSRWWPSTGTRSGRGYAR